MTRRMLILIHGILLAVVLVGGLAAVSAYPIAGPRPAITFTPVYGDEDAMPLILLHEFDPWRMVLGSDSPSFVVYETGQVIYRAVSEDGNVAYVSVTLDEDELQALVDELAPGDAFYALDEYYELAMKTDQPTSAIHVWNADDGVHEVSVYGDLRQDPEAREAAPAAYLELFDRLVAYEHPDAEPWLPEKLEVIIWPWATSDAAEWPADWPDLESPLAVRRGDDQYSIYLDIELADALSALVEDTGAIELGGATWAVSSRLPFPHEVVWPTNIAQPWTQTPTRRATG